ncbi:glutathione S-transferase family protein [Aquitalea sp. S1-19]|uniref:Glutathione S-transferase family protein n=1 Tax=Craterilacuibacter sinensis TaxID=2686017 RepID=A0A845BLY8_9NEIS|nr:glutathione binding-like protein [Craterilacuibacter sinensis]MCP9758747.1 glutathione S-transferase family protein [Aquitalea sp. S1-19]MXR37355.1 glutathione S-transferase family protein [Craterilacuibacter sinensis]RQW24610.1 glutathione S-transferase family protein [Rhodobacteraceae bacterium CH30]
MIELYTWGTPNGKKISVALEELDLPYTVFPVDINQGEQFAPDFLKISPNNKIPAIVDPDGPDGTALALFESGAILIYLADKTGRLLPAAGAARYRVLQWLMFQMGGFGPMLGQAHHFLRYAPETLPYAQKRYHDETLRLYGVLDRQLADHRFVAGSDYSIADIALYPWVARHEWHMVALADFPHVQRWADMMAARPAVQRGMAVPQSS